MLLPLHLNLASPKWTQPAESGPDDQWIDRGDASTGSWIERVPPTPADWKER